MNDFFDRVSSATNHDPDSLTWSGRAVGVISSICMNPDEFSKEQIVEFLTRLAELAPIESVANGYLALVVSQQNTQQN